MRLTLLVLIALAPGLALAQEKKADPKKKEKADGKVWMVKRGELL